MADGFSLEMLTKPFKDSVVEANRMVDKATMFALRSTGRYIIREARSKAPVSDGSDPRTAPGSLKKSIKNSRRLDHFGVGDYQMKVGPFGSTRQGTAVKRHGKSKGQVRGVPLYRSKMEAKYGYMAAGMGVGGPAMVAIYEEAYAKALAKFK